MAKRSAKKTPAKATKKVLKAAAKKGTPKRILDAAKAITAPEQALQVSVETAPKPAPKLVDVLALLKKLGACSEATTWVRGQVKKGATLQQLWERCERPDWMGWLARALNVERSLRMHAAADMAQVALDQAQSVMKHVAPGELRPQAALDVARRYADGKATWSELDTARDGARQARADAWARYDQAWSTAYQAELQRRRAAGEEEAKARSQAAAEAEAVEVEVEVEVAAAVAAAVEVAVEAAVEVAAAVAAAAVAAAAAAAAAVAVAAAVARELTWSEWVSIRDAAREKARPVARKQMADIIRARIPVSLIVELAEQRQGIKTAA